MGHWAQVQLSGSNFYSNKLYITASDNNDVNYEVVVWDITDGKLYSTGSYKNAGTTDPFSVDWFPYNGNVNLTTSPSDYLLRTLLLRQTTASLPPSNAPNIIDNGIGRIFFLTSGTLAGATIDDWTLKIQRNSGANSTTTIQHTGTGDTEFSFTDEQGAAETTIFRKIGDYVTNQAASGLFANVTNLETTSGTNSASLASGTYNNTVLFVYYNDIPTQFDIPIETEFMGAQFFIRDWVDSTYADVTWSYQNPNDNSLYNLTTYTRTETTPTNRLIGAYTTGSWGLSPQPGNDVVYMSDWLDTGGQNGLLLILRNVFVHNPGGGQNYNIAGGTLAPRLSIKYKTLEGEIKFVESTGTTLFATNGNNSNLFAQFDGPTGVTANQIHVYNNGSSFEWVRQLNALPDGSTKRIKTNIQNYKGPLLDNFDKLRPVTFNYTDRDDKSTHGGFLAEELAQLSPSSVIYGPNYKINNGYLDVKSPPIDNTLVPLDIKDRDIMAAAVAKLNQLNKELDYL